jgi:tagatose-6-phosphate ketose/aldose isomerase
MGRMKTVKEISFQPELYSKVHSHIFTNWFDKSGFLKKLLIRQNLYLILTGAGTSEYIGEILEDQWQCSPGKILFNNIITLLFNNKN